MSITNIKNTVMDDMAEPCQQIIRTAIPDGFGGFKYQYKNGTTFDALVRKDTSTESLIAEKQGIVELYTIVVDKSVPITYNDIIRHLPSGDTLRIASRESNKIPKTSLIGTKSFVAERWDFPA